MEFKEITSTTNDIIKYTVKLQNPKFRKKEKLILADGEKTIQGFIDEGVEFECVFSTEEIKNIKAKTFYKITPQILNKISTLTTPQGAIGIIKEPEYDKNIFFDMKKIALVENIKDAGNLGTIIRSACAFSMDGIILFGDCVDIYNSKTIRATAQNIFKIPIIAANDLDFIKKLSKDHPIISTVAKSDEELFKYKFPSSFMLALGSEAMGLSEKILDISYKKLTIKMDNNVESLNLGVCASIAFAYLKLN